MLYLEIQEGKERIARQKYVGENGQALTIIQTLNLTIPLLFTLIVTLTPTLTLTLIRRRVPGNISLHSAHAGCF